MPRRTPSFINDSFLANSIYELLRQAGRPLTGTEIAAQVLAIQNLPGSLAESMLEIILNEDARFCRMNENRWDLVRQELSSKQLEELEYVVLDVEIIGHARSPHIIEIAGYRIVHHRITDEWGTFINPGRAIIPKILSNLSGELRHIITTETLQQAPTFEEILPDFSRFIGNRVLVAHNAGFDLRMINRELKRLGYKKLVNWTIDTLRISRKLIRGVDTQQLANLAYYFGIPMEEIHLAKSDARTLAHIFLKLLERLKDAGIEYFNQLTPFLLPLNRQ